MFKLVVATAALTVVSIGSAWADAAAGDACAGKLTADGQAIYAATMAAKPKLPTLRDTLEKETKSLAMGNKVARGTARDNALAAEGCLKAALQ